MAELLTTPQVPLWDSTIPPPDLSRWDEVRRLADRLCADLDRIVDRVVERLCADIPFYAELESSDVRTRVAAQIGIGIACLREPRLPTPDELEVAASIVDVRTRQGLPFEEMLHAYRLSMWEAWRHGLAVAQDIGIEPLSMLEAAHLIWRLHDVLTSTAAIAHRRVEIETARTDHHHRDEFLRRLLFGTLPAAELRVRAPAYGILTDRPYVPFRARPADGVSPDEMERAFAARARVEGGLVGLVEGDVAGVLPRRPPGDGLVATVGVGPPARIEELEPSFSLASRALETAQAAGRSGVFALEDLPLEAMILSERYIGDHLVGRFVRPLGDLGAFGAEIALTLRAYLRNGLRIEETARELYVHPNTLRHRLARFREITGADLSRPRDLFCVWWALERATMAGGDPGGRAPGPGR